MKLLCNDLGVDAMKDRDTKYEAAAAGEPVEPSYSGAKVRSCYYSFFHCRQTARVTMCFRSLAARVHPTRSATRRESKKIKDALPPKLQAALSVPSRGCRPNTPELKERYVFRRKSICAPC